MFKQKKEFQPIYETSRLYLKILDEASADMVLTFLNQGADIFNEYENEKPSDFYTRNAQQRILHFEYELAMQQKAVRFYVFEKTNPGIIIGTVSISAVRPSPFRSAMIGYKIHPAYWNKGYGTEAVRKVITTVGPILDVHRIEGFVLPENVASCNLLSKAGFHLEGTARLSLEVKGIRRDHLQYSYIVENKV